MAGVAPFGPAASALAQPAAPSAVPSSAPAESPSATPATPAPATATPATTAPATAGPPVQPSAAATPTYRYVYRATPAPDATPFPLAGTPQIFEIDLTDQYLVTPGRLDVRVFTSPDVATVTAGTMGYTIPIPKVGPGRFGGTSRVDAVPWFLKDRLFPIDFTARTPGGQQADVTLQLGLK